MRLRKVLLVGYPIHVRAVRKFFNRNARRWRILSAGESFGARNLALLKVPFVDAVVALGGPGPDAVVAACARRLGVPVGVIWAGTDVVSLQRGYDAPARVRARCHTHAGCSAEITAELRKLGIDAREVPIVAADVPDRVAPFPSQFRVLAYGPSGGERLYGLDVLLAAARRFPAIHFDIIGGMEPVRSAPSNVAFHGWSNRVEKRLDASTVLLRPTRHDGLSRMVVEALSRGRHVVWTKELYGARCARTNDDVFRHLCELESAHRAGALEINHEGLRCVREYYSPQSVGRSLEDFFDEVRAARPAPKRRGVVSGSPQRVAAFVEAAASAMPEWEFRAAIGGSRSERFLDIVSLVFADRWYSLGETREDALFRKIARLVARRRTRVTPATHRP
jgi:hypothetical protein